MQIDCYGFEASSQWFRRKELEVYLMKEVEGILCPCYGNYSMQLWCRAPGKAEFRRERRLSWRDEISGGRPPVRSQAAGENMVK